jgi:two-component system CitB family sensor kinase
VTVLIQENNGEVLVRVSDSGPGIADAEAAFRRGWSTRQAGRGIGLALVRQVVERHGGSYGVAATGSGGAEVSVRLPVPAR